MNIFRLPSGRRFSLLGEKKTAPAPTLFVFAGRIENSLEGEDYNKAGLILARAGYLCASLDLPCHGEDVKEGEQAGSLKGWRTRLEKGESLLGDFLAGSSEALDYLIQEGYTSSQDVAACGTSRGGFAALHFAAAEPRVRCVAAFAPVADLRALSEFAGMEKHPGTVSVSLHNVADKLAGRAVWLCIGNNDQRVSTDNAIALTRKIVEASVGLSKPANVELHVMVTEGHRIHDTAHPEAAAWILSQVGR